MLLFAERMTYRIRYCFDGYDQGALQVPEEMKDVLTVGNLINVVKKIANQNKNFALYCDGDRHPPEAKLSDVLSLYYAEHVVIDSEGEEES